MSQLNPFWQISATLAPVFPRPISPTVFLNNGHLSGAGLDVWEKEPPNPDHKLLKMQNVVATPHMAGVTVDSRKKMSEFVANQLLNILSGGIPERPVNKEILSSFQSKFSKII